MAKFIFMLSLGTLFVTPLYGEEMPLPIAKFSFNKGKNYDEIGRKVIKMPGTSFTEDRFGNKNSAVYLFGHELSYLNLGTSQALKPKSGSISIWVKVENMFYSGRGRLVNPIILTKRSRDADFYESYGLGYYPETKNVVAVCSYDTTREVSISGISEFELRVWHHLVITYDYNTFSFYIDGELEKTLPKKFETHFDKQDSVLVGATGSKKNHRFLNACVDDIEFYDRVLNEEEIKTLYNAPNPNQLMIIVKWVLISLFFLALLLIVALTIKYRFRLALKREKQQLEIHNLILETELRVNRALMNPHFVFNSLNALQNFILKKEFNDANNYLVKFSKLIRRILENNISDEITLENEIDLLNRYLELEDLRFEENISYKISVDKNIIPGSIKIPVMMLQPFVENAIWHGLLNKENEKLLLISFSITENNYLLCCIDDNGIGRKNPKMNDEKKSLATVFIEQRLSLLNRIYGLESKLIIVDKKNESGTIVKIYLPILNKKNNVASNHS